MTLSKRSATSGWRVSYNIAGNGTSQPLRSIEFQLSILYFLEYKNTSQGKGDILSDGLGEGCEWVSPSLTPLL